MYVLSHRSAGNTNRIVIGSPGYAKNNGVLGSPNTFELNTL